MYQLPTRQIARESPGVPGTALAHTTQVFSKSNWMGGWVDGWTHQEYYNLTCYIETFTTSILDDNKQMVRKH